MFQWFGQLWQHFRLPEALEGRPEEEPKTGSEVFEEWEHDLVCEVVETRFAPEYQAMVLAELTSLRRRWNILRAQVPVRPGQPACLGLRERLALIEESRGDPMFFIGKRYQTPERAWAWSRTSPSLLCCPGRNSEGPGK